MLVHLHCNSYKLGGHLSLVRSTGNKNITVAFYYTYNKNTTQYRKGKWLHSGRVKWEISTISKVMAVSYPISNSTLTRCVADGGRVCFVFASSSPFPSYYTLHTWFQFSLYILRFSVWKNKVSWQTGQRTVSTEQWACLFTQNGSFKGFRPFSFEHFQKFSTINLKTSDRGNT